MQGKTHASRYQNRLSRAIAQDPKKAAVLSVLVVVMLVMWGRAMFKGGAGPAAAVAAASDQSKDVSVEAQTMRNDRIRSELNTWLASEAPPVNRNLFAVKFDYFQQDASGRAGQTLRAPEGDGFWDKLAKSMTDQADQKQEQRILVENLRLQAAQLRLQTTMMGASPKALINDSLVGEGDVVAKSEFRVLKIEPRRIIVERKGIKLAIEMK